MEFRRSWKDAEEVKDYRFTSKAVAFSSKRTNKNLGEKMEDFFLESDAGSEVAASSSGHGGALTFFKGQNRNTKHDDARQQTRRWLILRNSGADSAETTHTRLHRPLKMGGPVPSKNWNRTRVLLGVALQATLDVRSPLN